MGREAIDTNVALRLVLGDVPEQTQLAETLLTRPGVRFDLPDAAVVELVFALEHHYGLSRDQTTAVVQSLSSVPNLDVSSVFDAVIAQYGTHPKLSFADCYLAESARTDGTLPLWTFDKKLANQHAAARLLDPQAVSDVSTVGK